MTIETLYTLKVHSKLQGIDGKGGEYSAAATKP